jgi:hypothetical protein
VTGKWPAAIWTCSVLLLSGCGSSAAPTYHQGDAKVPACAHAGKAIPLPPGFPAGFPIPPHTAITSHTRSFGAVIIDGFVPASSFDDVQSFFTKKLPDAGYTLSEQDAEPPREAEARYSGKGYEGGWRIRSIFGCSGVFTLEASASPRPTKS